MRVKILIDSASDIDYLEAAGRNLELISMAVTFGDRVYADGLDLTKQEFFEKLIESDTLPQTSQVNPFQFEEAYARLTADGSDVVVITISSRLSGTYNSAMTAAADYQGRIFVVDSLNVSIGERLLIFRALTLRDQGLSAEEIACRLDQEKKEIRVMALLDTLEYLQKGGRVSAAVASAGTLLHIKPVISIQDGEVKLIGKAMGSKRGNNLLIQLAERSGGIDFSMPYATAYSGLEDSLLQKYKKDSASLWEEHTAQLPSYCIGSTIGTHVGPGAIAVAFFIKHSAAPASQPDPQQ